MIDVVHPLSTLLDIFEHLVMAVSLCEECGSVGGTQSESLCKRWSAAWCAADVQYYKFTEFCTINSTTLDILNSQHNRDHNEPKHLDSVCSERAEAHGALNGAPPQPHAPRPPPQHLILQIPYHAQYMPSPSRPSPTPLLNTIL